MANHSLGVDFDLDDRMTPSALICDKTRFQERFVLPAATSLSARLKEMKISLDTLMKPEAVRGVLYCSVGPCLDIPWLRVLVAFGPVVVGREENGEPILDMRWIGRADVFYRDAVSQAAR